MGTCLDGPPLSERVSERAVCREYCIATWRNLRSGAGGGGADAAAAAKIVRKLGKAKVANMFAHMRKIAQHPLLVRSHFSDKQVVAIAKLAYARLASAKPLKPVLFRMPL